MNYFDHAASTSIYPEIEELLTKAQREDFANPSAKHLLGHNLNEKIEMMRADFLKSISASLNDDFVFTSSATESNNTVMKGLQLKPGDVVLYSKADHPSLTAPLEDLVEEKKIELKEIILTAEGLIDEEVLDLLLSSKVKLVTLTHINNQSGVIQNIETLTNKIKSKTSAHVHIDAVQSFGKIDFKIHPSIDSASFTSHKIGGPKGIAGLYLKKDHKVKPLLLGGGQENGFRSSTVSYPLILGFHQAMKISLRDREKSFLQTLSFNEIIKSKLIALLPTAQFPFKTISPFILSFILPKVSSDIILRHLEMEEIFISSTSACSSKIQGLNSSFLAMNIPEKFHKNFLRISLGPKTTKEEVDGLLKGFEKTWNNIKHII